MLLKLGVDISRLEKPIRCILGNIDSLFISITGEESVITSTYEGNHSPSSLHYGNLAVDFRLPKKKADDLISAIRSRLSQDYDVVLETDHIHVEYDPKR
jgi:hypothetical protein